jgi:sialate O-acetylesterase
VGRRLARAARHVIYGDAIAPSGPVPLSAHRTPDGIVVTFGDVEGHLVTYSADLAIGFELCGAGTGSCRFAAGRADGTRIVLPTTASDETATRVRFCWGASPLCNLSDGSGLPAGPFEMPIQ